MATRADDIVEAIRAVRDEAGSFALVAELDEVIVGHVQFSWASVGDSPLVILGPVGVLPDHQRRGIGSKLIRRGLEEAQGRGEPAVILLGDPRFLSTIRVPGRLDLRPTQPPGRRSTERFRDPGGAVHDRSAG
jgi:predicted N-acetyltransferase YhbS